MNSIRHDGPKKAKLTHVVLGKTILFLALCVLGRGKVGVGVEFCRAFGNRQGVRVFDNARRGRFCGARRALGAIAAVSVAIPPRAGPLGRPSERKIPKRTALFTGRIWKATGFLVRPLRIWRTNSIRGRKQPRRKHRGRKRYILLGAICFWTPEDTDKSPAENTGTENKLILLLALHVLGRGKTILLLAIYELGRGRAYTYCS